MSKKSIARRRRLATLTVLAIVASAPAAKAVEIAGPQCTPTWPRGFKVDKFKGSKKRPLKLCIGDISRSWGGCIERHGA